MSKTMFRVVLSDGSSSVVAALSEFNARMIVEASLRDEPLDRGLSIVRIEEHSSHRWERPKGRERLRFPQSESARPRANPASVFRGI